MTDSTIFSTNYDNTIIGDKENNTLTGGQLADHILGIGGDDILYGLGGNDFIEGGENYDTLYGGEGQDILFGEEGDDLLYGEAGNDLLVDSYGVNFLDGGIGNDTLNGGSEIQFMYGGADNDTYRLFGSKYQEYVGYNYIDDTSGYDKITFSNVMRSIYLNLDRTDEQLINPYLKLDLASNNQIEQAVGTYDGDFIIGNALSNILQGGDISDSLYGKDPSFLDKDYFLGGAGDDILQGYYGDDILKGEADNDVLDGGGGIDSTYGGTGNDTYYVDRWEDTIVEDSTIVTESDTVYSTSDYALSANVERLVLNLSGTGISAFGNNINNSLTGNNFNNYLYGYGGDDTLVGGAGIDTAYGGDGNDIYFVDSSFDVVVETNTSTTQIDTVKAFTSYVLSANVENLQLLGTTFNGTGNNLNNTITGNNANNVFFGLDGNDILDGDGGGDTMYGGTGNDIYYVDHSGDLVVETSTTATEVDTVFASISYTLAANVENLTLTGLFAGSGTGNNLNNTIAGNSLNNTLAGGEGNDTLDGSTGVDTLIGGGGNDLYYVDNKDEVVTETSTSATEIDTVRASTDHYLRSNVEHLILTESALSGFGNNLNNLIVGNNSNNHLEGGIGNDTLEGSLGSDYLDGGFGSDTMRGGIGGDIYIVDNINDIVVEPGLSEDPNPFPTESMAVAAIAPEYDKIFASVNYFLSDNIEELHLTGTANLTGTGNYLNNALFGGEGNDTLIGAAGSDTLVGGAGDDILTGGNDGDKFMFAGDTPFTRFGKTTVDPNYGVDRISDFSREDVIVLDKTVFSSLQSFTGNGFSVANEFVVVATDAEVTMSRGFIVYSQATGNLFYNQNSTNPDFGSGGWFATVANAPILTSEDFALVV
jgi:Ca2+-binding RTX toxin-like protein